MSAMASQITSLTIVYSTVCLFRHRWKKTSKLCVTGFCAANSPVTGKFPAQRVSNAENVFIWWRHHEWPRLRDCSLSSWWPHTLPGYLFISYKIHPKNYAHGSRFVAWDEITYPFPNFNGYTVEVWEWISKFTTQFLLDVMTSI